MTQCQMVGGLPHRPGGMAARLPSGLSSSSSPPTRRPEHDSVRRRPLLPRWSAIGARPSWRGARSIDSNGLGRRVQRRPPQRPVAGARVSREARDSCPALSVAADHVPGNTRYFSNVAKKENHR